MIKVWKLLSVSIVLAVCLGLLLVPAMGISAGEPGAGKATFLMPAEVKVTPGQAFAVNVTIYNPNNIAIYSAGADMVWSTPSMLGVTGIDGSVWPTELTKGWDNATGEAYYVAGGSTGSPNITTANITHCTVHFVAGSSEGVVTVNFASVTWETLIYDVNTDDLCNWSAMQNLTVKIGTTLTVNVTPAGKGTVKANGVNLTGYPNSTNWSWDVNVTLEAVNSTPGYTFVNWTGDLSGSTNPKNITMDNFTKNVTANFYGQEPAISPVPANLTFSGNVGGNVTNKTLQICNGGGGILNWTANITGANATLFSMSPMNGTNLTAAQCSNSTVAVNTTGLAAGNYTANITINSTAAENKTVPVTLTLGVPGVPEISASPTSLTFTTHEGVNPPDQTLDVCNMGNGTLNWSVSDGGTAWLSETPTSGSLGADDCKDVTVSVDVAGMEAGDYSATITITGSPTVSVPVNLHIVSAVPELPVEPAHLSASGLSISPQQVKPGQEVTISINVANTGGETGSYNAVLYINGVVEASQSVSVAPGMTKNVIFAVTKSNAGVYDVSIAGQSGQFTVVHTGWFGGGLGTGGIVAIVVIVIVLILALFFVLRGTRRAI
jgi:uncharacterized repeat protein (TIGR02543 family)